MSSTSLGDIAERLSGIEKAQEEQNEMLQSILAKLDALEGDGSKSSGKSKAKKGKGETTIKPSSVKKSKKDGKKDSKKGGTKDKKVDKKPKKDVKKSGGKSESKKIDDSRKIRMDMYIFVCGTIFICALVCFL